MRLACKIRDEYGMVQHLVQEQDKKKPRPNGPVTEPYPGQEYHQQWNGNVMLEQILFTYFENTWTDVGFQKWFTHPFAICCTQGASNIMSILFKNVFKYANLRR